MAEVNVIYEFQVIAGPGQGVTSLAATAWTQAQEYFGAGDFGLDLDVKGRKGQWEVMATASRVVEVNL